MNGKRGYKMALAAVGAVLLAVRFLSDAPPDTPDRILDIPGKAGIGYCGLAGTDRVPDMPGKAEYGLHSPVFYLESADGEASLYEHQWTLNNHGQVRLVERMAGTTLLLSGPGLENGRNLESDPDVRQIIDGKAEIDIRAEAAWEDYRNLTGRRQVVVALIDTGVDFSHPDLTGGIWANPGEIPGDGIDNDGNGYVDDVYGWNFNDNSPQVYAGSEDDHGTHAAGTIIGSWDQKGVTGIADSSYVKIMVLKALGPDGKGDSAKVTEAVRYARANGAMICNLSFGADIYDPELDGLIRDSGMLFVISAGNGDASGMGMDIDSTPVYPAAFENENIISVANLMFDGNLHTSSNYGAESVDLAAPGSYILSTVGGHGYGYMTGTSMAAPMVTGAAALTASCRPEFSVSDIRNALISSARHLDSLEGKVSSGGMLDAHGAVSYRIDGKGAAGDPPAIG